MKSVFISYAFDSASTEAHAVADALRTRGASVWIADQGLGGGSNYAAEIPGAIERSDLVVVFLTEAGIASEHVQREAHLAVSKRRRLLPVTFGRPIDSMPDQWQYWLGTTQTIPFRSVPEVVSAAWDIACSTVVPDPAPMPHCTSLRDAFRRRTGPDELRSLVRDGLVDEERGLLDLECRLAVEIDRSGGASLTYEHLVLNATGEARGGLPQREVWFEHTAKLSVHAAPQGEDRSPIRIKVVHDAGHILKFLPRFTAPLAGGEERRFAYVVAGGRFVQDHYWSQSFPRYTSRYSVDLTADGGLAWVEGWRRDVWGDEHEVTVGIECREEGDATRVHAEALWLQPGEVYTLKWGDRE